LVIIAIVNYSGFFLQPKGPFSYIYPNLSTVLAKTMNEFYFPILKIIIDYFDLSPLKY